MLDTLRFVQGAVAKKDFVPSLTHFRIKDGFIRGFNGALGLSSPIDLDLDICPKANQLVKAIQTCKGDQTIHLSLTKAGRLAVKSGSFKAFVDCSTETFPEVEPEGEKIEIRPGLLQALKLLTPFIAEDASREWARGILFRGESAFATNNIILVEHWLGYQFPVEINIPKTTIAEILRIGEDPLYLQVDVDSVTFHYEGNRWLRSQLFSTKWPDIGKVIAKGGEAQTPLPETLWQGLEDLSQFVDELGRVYLEPGIVRTHLDEGLGAVVEVPGLEAAGCYNLAQLLSLKKVVDSIDLSDYPQPCIFYGDQIRGAIIGMRT